MVYFQPVCDLLRNSIFVVPVLTAATSFYQTIRTYVCSRHFLLLVNDLCTYSSSFRGSSSCGTAQKANSNAMHTLPHMPSSWFIHSCGIFHLKFVVCLHVCKRVCSKSLPLRPSHCVTQVTVRSVCCKSCVWLLNVICLL